MEAATAPARTRMPAWLAGLMPLLSSASPSPLFVALDAPGLERNGIPVEELVGGAHRAAPRARSR